jgi:hypothetical protein
VSGSKKGMWVEEGSVWSTKENGDRKVGDWVESEP